MVAGPYWSTWDLKRAILPVRRLIARSSIHNATAAARSKANAHQRATTPVTPEKAFFQYRNEDDSRLFITPYYNKLITWDALWRTGIAVDRFVDRFTKGGNFFEFRFIVSKSPGRVLVHGAFTAGTPSYCQIACISGI